MSTKPKLSPLYLQEFLSLSSSLVILHLFFRGYNTSFLFSFILQVIATAFTCFAPMINSFAWQSLDLGTVYLSGLYQRLLKQCSQLPCLMLSTKETLWEKIKQARLL